MSKYKLKQYKGVDLFYEEETGKIIFGFEGVERTVKYVFEAMEIIDEPVWEDCNLDGYFVDGYVDKIIGLAKATRKDRKSGKPDWLLKGEYDLEYKRPSWSEKTKVVLKSKQSDMIYENWKNQRNIYIRELSKLNEIASKLDQKSGGE